MSKNVLFFKCINSGELVIELAIPFNVPGSGCRGPQNYFSNVALYRFLILLRMTLPSPPLIHHHIGHVEPVGSIHEKIGHMVPLGSIHNDIGHMVPLEYVHGDIGHVVPPGIIILYIST